MKKAIKITFFAILIIGLFCSLNKQNKKGIENCIKAGYSEEFCIVNM